MAYEDRMCENCGRSIGKLEIIEKWQLQPVCRDCYIKLATPVTPTRALGLTSHTQCLFVLIVGAVSIPVIIGIPLIVWALLAWVQIAAIKDQINRDNSEARSNHL